MIIVQGKSDCYEAPRAYLNAKDSAQATAHTLPRLNPHTHTSC